MSLPYDAAYNGVANTLWVLDTFNSRLLRFSKFIVRVQNLSSLDVVITFQGQQPTVFAYPKGLFAQSQAIEELDSNDTVISTSASLAHFPRKKRPCIHSEPLVAEGHMQ